MTDNTNDPVGVLISALEPVADPRLEDLRYIVKRLARKLAKADPNSGEPSGALIYLRRVGLIGSPLRAAPDRAPSTDSAADALRLEFMMEREAWIAWSKDGESCRLFHRNDDGEPMPMLGWGARHWSHDPRQAIDAAIAASLPQTKEE